MNKCLMCGDETNMIINIKMKAKPLCNKCSFGITKQTTLWLCDNFVSDAECVKSQQNADKKDNYDAKAHERCYP